MSSNRHHAIVSHVFVQLRFSKWPLSDLTTRVMESKGPSTLERVESPRSDPLHVTTTRHGLGGRSYARGWLGPSGLLWCLPKCALVLLSRRVPEPESCRAPVSFSFEKIGEILCVDENYFSCRPQGSKKYERPA